MQYPPDLIVDNETVPVPLPAVTARLIVSNKVAGSVSFGYVPVRSNSCHCTNIIDHYGNTFPRLFLGTIYFFLTFFWSFF